MHACLILQPIDPAGPKLLRELVLASVETLRTESVVAVITRDAPIDEQFLIAHPDLRVIGKHGTGLDAIDLDAATRRGIPVVWTPGANAAAVAEHTIGLMFAVAKRVCAADRAARIADRGFRVDYPSLDLAGATLGIVGFGAIGRRVALLGRALGMQVMVFSHHADAKEIEAVGATRANTLLELAAVADVFSLHAMLRAGSHQMVDAACIAALKPGAIFINTARAELVDQRALVAALERGALTGAALDVFDASPSAYGDRLMGIETVTLSPHLGGSSPRALRDVSLTLCAGIADVLAGRTPEFLANPSVRIRP